MPITVTLNGVDIEDNDPGDTNSLVGFINVTGTDNSLNDEEDVIRVKFGTSGDRATLDGGAGDDTITGATSIDKLLGGAGNDLITGNGAGDTLEGGLGNDTINHTGFQGAFMEGDEGNDILGGSGAADTLNGGLGSDTVNGNGGSDVLRYLTFQTNAGDEDFYNGGSGSDTLRITYSDVDDYNTHQADVLAFFEHISAGNAATTFLINSLNLNVTNVENLELQINGEAGFIDPRTIFGTDGDDTLLAGSALDDVIFGLDGDDYLQGLDGNDTLDGGRDSDTLEGGAGNDSLIGGRGTDTLDGGTGADYMEGGRENDRYFVDDVNDVVVEASNGGTFDIVTTSVSYTVDDNIELVSSSGSAPITITGNTQNNWINGNSADNLLIGLEGVDRLEGKGGNDTLDGGLGNDLLFASDGSDTFILAEGDGIDTIREFNAGEDVLDFTNSGVSIADIRVEQAGTGTRITYTDSGDSVVLIDVDYLSVNSSFFAFAPSGVAEFIGDTGNNNLAGTSADEVYVGFAGNDTLNARAGADTMIGGAGDDQYFLDDVNDVVVELAFQGYDRMRADFSFTLSDNIEAGNAQGIGAINITGNELDNWLTGNDESNILTDDIGRDRFEGRGGNDTIIGGVDNDVLNGGAGADEFVFRSNDGIDIIQDFEVGVDKINIVDLGVAYNELTIIDTPLGVAVIYDATPGNTGLVTLQSAGGTPFTSLDILSDSFITVFGDNQPPITGTENGETIVGTPDTDEIIGLGGNDNLNGKQGADTMIGGTGNDRYFVDNVADVVVELAGEGTDTITAAVNYTLSANVENGSSDASATDISITGNELDNWLTGDSGVNTLSGLIGNDRLSGRDGNDILLGGQGNDRLEGEVGNDFLTGGLGADIAIGGTGSDTFIFTDLTHSDAVNGQDVINDFAVGSDVIDVRGLGFSSLDDDGGATEAGELKLSFNAGNGRTEVSSDQVAFEFFMVGDYTATLSNTDFLFI